MPRIADIIKAKGYPQEIAEAVRAHAETSGTIARIESGELVLPDPRDAAKFYDVLTGKTEEQRQQAERDKRLEELESRIRDIEKGG